MISKPYHILGSILKHKVTVSPLFILFSDVLLLLLHVIPIMTPGQIQPAA